MMVRQSPRYLPLLLLVPVLSILRHFVEANQFQYSAWSPHDTIWKNQVAANRRFLTKKSRESLQQENRLLAEEELQHANDNNNSDKNQQEEHPQDPRDLEINPGTPVLNVVVCLMQWKNHPDRNTKLSREDVDAMFNNEGRNGELYPGGTVKEYFSTMSYGEMEMNFEVTDWIMTDYTEQQFTADGSQGRTQELQKAFEPVLQSLDDSLFKFKDFDSNFDRSIDLVVFLHSGYDGSEGGTDCETGKTALQRVASHARTGADQSTWMSQTGYLLGAYAVAPAFRGTCDLKIGRIGTIVHEMIHPFGLPDLYDGEGEYSTGELGGIARFGTMANPSGNAGDLAWPGHISGWTRKELGWITPTEIDSDGTYILKPVEENPEMFIIKKGFEDREYLLIENRQPIQGDFDEKFFDPGGIVVYHVDENIWDAYSDGSLGTNIPRGGPFLSGWPGNGKHYPVAILQADGLYELEQGINGGQSADIYNEPSQVLGPGNGERTASKANYPNTDSYAFGTIVKTGITLTNFKKNGGSAMSFQVCGLSGGKCDINTGPAPAPPTKTPTKSPQVPDTKAPTKAPTKTSQVPDTKAPTKNPVTKPPTKEPTEAPTEAPTEEPIEDYLDIPTSGPTFGFSEAFSPLDDEPLENGRCETAADAFEIRSADGNMAFSNMTDGGISLTCYGEDREGVWYKMEAGSASAGETIIANTCLSETNAMSKISVLKGDSCTTLKCVEVDGIGCRNGKQGHVVYWTAEADEDYYMFAHSVDDSDEIVDVEVEDSDEIVDVDTLSAPSGEILRLKINIFPPVVNDDCGAALTVPTDGSVISGSTVGARPEVNLTRSETCGVKGAGVWFKVIGTGSDLRATTCLSGTSAPTRIHVFSGSCDSLSCISVEANNLSVCNNYDISTNSATVNWESEEGVEYFILVGSRNRKFGDFELSVSEFEPALNDHCPSAIEVDIPEIQSSLKGSTEDGTNDFPYGDYCGLPLDTAGVWYTVEGTGEGLSMSTCGKRTYNSAISIFTGSDCDELQCLTGSATADPSCGYSGVTAGWKSELNETYYVYVHGIGPNSYGTFDLEAEKFFETEYNVLCNAALPIVEPGVTVKANATNATHSAPSKVCVAETTHPGVWYTYEGTGFPFLMNACPNGVHDYDVSISVFSGDSCGELSCESGITFTQEFCGGPIDETSLNRNRDLEEGLFSVESEVGVIYHIFVHGEISKDSNITAVDVEDFEIAFFPQIPLPTTPPSNSSDPSDDTSTKGTKSSFKFEKKHALMLAILVPLLLMCIFLIPLYLVCRKKKESDEDGDAEWNPSKPVDSRDMWESPFNDERSINNVSMRSRNTQLSNKP